MADEDFTDAEDSAEKAYAAAAAEAVPVKAEPEPEAASEAPAVPAPSAPDAPLPTAIEFPAKAKRAKPAAKTAPLDPPAKPAVPELPKRAAPKRVASKPPVPAKPVAASKPAAATLVKKKPITQVAPKVAKPKASLSINSPAPSKLKEISMETSQDYVEGVKKAATDTQTKAKKVFEKGTAMFGEYADFAKGNVEALVESGKILATGVQGIGSSMLSDGKTAIETATADVKQLTSAKSPTEFFQVQTDILRRNVDSAVSLGSKNSETLLKLAADAFAPISGRFSLAMEKLKTAA